MILRLISVIGTMILSGNFPSVGVTTLGGKHTEVL